MRFRDGMPHIRWSSIYLKVLLFLSNVLCQKKFCHHQVLTIKLVVWEAKTKANLNDYYVNNSLLKSINVYVYFCWKIFIENIVLKQSFFLWTPTIFSASNINILLRQISFKKSNLYLIYRHQIFSRRQNAPKRFISNKEYFNINNFSHSFVTTSTRCSQTAK